MAILFVLLATYGSFSGLGKSSYTQIKSYFQPQDSTVLRNRILRYITILLQEGHYHPKNINDSFSRLVFDKYFQNLDFEKNIFLQSDIEALAPIFKEALDDEMLGKYRMDFMPAVNIIFQQRVKELDTLYKEILSMPMNFEKEEFYSNLEYQTKQFTKTKEQRAKDWNQSLKYYVLERYLTLLKQQEANIKDTSKKDFKPKPLDSLEIEARSQVKKMFDRRFKRLRKFDINKQFNAYINTISHIMDPHSDYLSPLDKRSFDEEISGKFYGIAAQLTYGDEGYVKISRVLSGGPAWKSKEIEAGDLIMKVGQNDDPLIDIAEYELEDAVKIIRGPKDTKVRLLIKKKEGTQKEIAIIRDEVLNDAIYARSAIIKKEGKKIGYIYLNEFYSNFSYNDTSEGSRCATDVERQVRHLNNEQVDGIIIDLRSNYGGSLPDVVDMIGNFVPKGPVVQVRSKNGESQLWATKPTSVLFKGPMIVLVNEESASAAEIFAAAMQDFNRSLIIGTNTYGKGTVQRPFGISAFFDETNDVGSLKLTIQKFYRITGGSTQKKGVHVDICLPSQYNYSERREKDAPFSLDYDTINKTKFTTFNPAKTPYSKIQKKYNESLKKNELFGHIDVYAKWIKRKNKERSIPLNINHYRQYVDNIENEGKRLDSILNLEKNDTLNIVLMASEELKLKKIQDTTRSNILRGWYDGLKREPYIKEATNIMLDMIDNKFSSQ
ncbi:MAG: carboxy terminal-processing peptidase [Chitinophagaceae bacterium]